jgi:hypothetical protein
LNGYLPKSIIIVGNLSRREGSGTDQIADWWSLSSATRKERAMEARDYCMLAQGDLGGCESAISILLEKIDRLEKACASARESAWYELPIEFSGP